MEISVVIPAYNEEENISILYKEIKQTLSRISKKYEIIFIDDGSTDNTYKELLSIYKKYKNIKIIQFSTNYGKSAALSAGFNEANGNIVITMDGDLQDDPDEIPNFIEKINSGYDLVSGWKFHRKDPPSKTIPSKIFNFTTNLITGIKIHDSNCGFKAYKKGVVDNIKNLIYGELHRYIPSIVHQKGFKITEIKVKHHPRIYGKSKYSSGRFIKGFLDLLTIKFLIKYYNSPLHLFGSFGVILMLIGFIFGLYLTSLWLRKIPIGNRPLVSLSVLLFIIGIQFLGLGLIGELLVNINKNQNKETYIIKKIIK